MRPPLGAVLSLVLLATSPASAQTWLGPTPYLSQADSPFAAAITAGDVVLEDFEDGILDAVGVTTTGEIIAASSLTDSVDADDGSIDGSGTGGHSLFSGFGSISFSFAPGSLPVDVGAVWTDGGGLVSFEAFDENGVTLGVQGPFDLPDASNNGETAEDRFLGVTYPGGISSFVVSNSAGGIEVDHLQLTTPVAVPCGPEPRTDCRGSLGPKGAKLGLADKREALKWSWSGEVGATGKSDFGQPTADTAYTLCLYDATESVASLALQASIPPGDGWKESATGFSYKRKDGDPDGVQKVSLKAGPAGSSKPPKIRVAGVDMALPNQPLAQSPEVVVQLLHDGGPCFEARFSAPALKNDEKAFKDIGD
jgi:hypothetical protein